MVRGAAAANATAFQFCICHSDGRCRSCSQIVTLDALGDVAVWSLTGGGVITTNMNGQFIPPPLACTMTLPPICPREGQDVVPPALLQLQRMFHFKQPSSSVRSASLLLLLLLLLPPPLPLPPTVALTPPYVPSCISFHPSFTVMGFHPSILVGLYVTPFPHCIFVTLCAGTAAS